MSFKSEGWWFLNKKLQIKVTLIRSKAEISPKFFNEEYILLFSATNNTFFHLTRLYSPLAVVVRSREPSLKLSHFKLVCGGSFYNEAFFGIPYNLIFERLDDTNLDRWYNTKNEIKIESNIFEEALRIPGKEEW